MTMQRKVTKEGRVNIGNEARGGTLTGMITISGSTRGILITPYREGDDHRPDCKVTEWDATQRIQIPLQLRQKAGLRAGDTVDVLFRDEDGGILLVQARDICTLCGAQAENMIRMPNGRLVCPRCRRILCEDES